MPTIQNANKMEQSKIVTIGPVFILRNVFLAVADVIAKAPYYKLRDSNEIRMTSCTTPEN